MNRIQFYDVTVQGPHFARVQYSSSHKACSYIAQVELTSFNEAVVLFPPAVYENPDDPVEFSEDDLQAILLMVIRSQALSTRRGASRYPP